ncbi:MAG: alpha/beta hydrolase [Opitutaceae bacterium]|nr:alpha/beta hydrolase [Opitutaceae bacterium]
MNCTHTTVHRRPEAEIAAVSKAADAAGKAVPAGRPRFCRRHHHGRAAAALLLLMSFETVDTVAATAEVPDVERKLQQRLEKFPEADANGDGVVTEQEARAHQKKQKPGKAIERGATSSGESTPTHANVRYGPHERNVLDGWRAPGDGPTPVLVFFHGGSFKAGDKSAVLARPIFSPCLAAGITVVSANYRFSSDAPFPAPMRDGARVVQFVRAKAREWNIDPSRIAVSGTSAGATMALWIALHDDLADPSGDEIARQSSRVTCASPHRGTAGLEIEYFKQHAGVTRLGGALFQLFGAQSQAEFEQPDKRALAREASPLIHATRDDPPLFLTYAGDPAEAPFKADAAQSAWIHHVALGLPLKSRYDALGLGCEFYYQSKPAATDAEIAFLKRHLLNAPRAER